jgi:hypothetical protein
VGNTIRKQSEIFLRRGWEIDGAHWLNFFRTGEA